MSVRDLLRRGATSAFVEAALFWERRENGIAFDPRRKDVRQDPYPLYRALRETSPVHRTRLAAGWIVTRYDDVLAGLHNGALSSDQRHSARWPRMRKMQLQAGRTQEQLDNPTMLTSDAPRHTRLRGLVSKAFTPRAIAGIEPRIREIARDLLDEVGDASQLDVMAALAVPLPVIVIAELLGVPASDRAKFKAWSGDALRGSGAPSLEELKVGLEAAGALTDYFRSIIEQRGDERPDDLLSGLLDAEEEGERLTMDELLGTCILLLVAGNETTTNLIGNGLLALLSHRDQLELLRADPSLLPGAVEEFLRYDPPVQFTARIATRDLEFGDVAMKKGQLVGLMLAAANRDPARFADPDRLDIARADNPHLGFGHGMHFCLGSSLARLEARVAFESMLERFPAMKLVNEQPAWYDSFGFRGLAELPVSV